MVQQIPTAGPYRGRPILRSTVAVPQVDRVRYPVDPWRWVETTPPGEDGDAVESLFVTANGYIGVRGNAEEGKAPQGQGCSLMGCMRRGLFSMLRMPMG